MISLFSSLYVPKGGNMTYTLVLECSCCSAMISKNEVTKERFEEVINHPGLQDDFDDSNGDKRAFYRNGSACLECQEVAWGFDCGKTEEVT